MKLAKQLFTTVAGLALATLLAVPAFAAPTPATPAPKAEIDVTKIVTTDDATKFPLGDEYKFKLEPVDVVMGRDGGTKFTKKDMPMPAADTNLNVTVDGVNENRTATLTIKGLASKDTVGDGDQKRDRDGLFPSMTYTNTGIYTYKLTEIIPTQGETGVIYDTTEYFINVYVTNVIDDVTKQPVVNADGTLAVTVSNITLYKETNGNIALQDKDNNDIKAEDADDDAKVAITTAPKTDDATTMAINAPFTNKFDVEDLTISKTVTGNLADPDKEFDFTFTPGDNATTGYEYTYEVYTMAGDAPAAGDVPVVPSKAGSFTDGGTNKVSLKHKQYVVVTGVPVGLKYTIAETAVTTPANPSAYTTAIEWQNGNATVDADHGTLGDIEKGTSVVTTGEKVIKTTTTKAGETGKRDNHAYYTNHVEQTTPTGVLLRVLPFVLLAGMLVAGIALMLLNRKKNRENGYQGL
ncbi:MAG: hypothetical protein PHO10_01125 [Gemmiger sp.]|nr:hypothetical protein [Gemmiger sp.]